MSEISPASTSVASLTVEGCGELLVLDVVVEAMIVTLDIVGPDSLYSVIMAAMCAPSILEYNAAEQVLSVLISSAYRRNSLTKMNLAECATTMLSALRRCTKHGFPIQLTVLAFPFKVPNPAKIGARRLPDFAELAAIGHLSALREAIQIVYPPGLEFHILHDGSLIADAFGIELQEVHQYEAYFAKLVTMSQASNFIHCHDFSVLQRRSGLDPFDSIQQLQLAAKRWWQERRGTAEWRLAFRKTLGMVNLRELPVASITRLMNHASLGQLPAGFEELERRVHEAMMQYHVKDAVIHQFDPRACCFPDAIHATTQDRQGRLSIWLVRRGQSLLPWHGVGCLDDRGRTRVVRVADIQDQPNYYPAFFGGEETPFIYRNLTTSEPLGFEALHEWRANRHLDDLFVSSSPALYGTERSRDIADLLSPSWKPRFLREFERGRATTGQK